MLSRGNASKKEEFHKFLTALFLCVAILTNGTPASATSSAASCEEWNTNGFFRDAGIAEVSHCLTTGADPNARNKNGETPLHRAARWSKTPSIITALVQAGAKVNARNKDRWTPLHHAARWSTTPGVIAALVSGGGGNPNARGKNAKTPLHQAARYSKTPAVVIALLEAGADLSAQDKNGLTPLQLANKKGNSAVAAILEEAEAAKERKQAEGQENPGKRELLIEQEPEEPEPVERQQELPDNYEPQRLAGQGGSTPTITLSAAPNEISEDDAPTSVTITASLSEARAAPTEITLSLGGSASLTTDYTTGPIPSITIPAGETTNSEAAGFLVTPVDDSFFEGNETIEVAGTAGGLMVTSASVTLKDTETIPTLVLTSPDTHSLEEGGDALTTSFGLTLRGGASFESDLAVSINVRRHLFREVQRNAGAAARGHD